ncbi:MAG TPA: TonB-dependent receptor [Kofleriaceae bacterium]|nr:TonB-dependent receptor [Kofleriaceae bacterium]
MSPAPPSSLAAAALVAALATAAHAQAPTTAVRGTVVDRATRAPVAGAIVAAGGELVATGDDGRFSLALPPGEHALEISAPWLVTRRQVLRLTGQPELELVIEVDPAAKIGGEVVEIVEIAPTAPGETRVAARLARAVPGGGDAAKIVHSLPAVARPPAGSAEIVVWGAAPRDTRVYVDGVPVPALFHLGGYRAAVGNDLVGDIRLTPAAFGPERGRAIGGVIDIALADPAAAPAWRVQADVLDGSAAGRRTLGGVTVAGAIRQGWLDRAIGAIADPATLAPNAPLPQWTDAQIAARAALPGGATATGWVIGALDALDRTLASDDPGTRTTQRIDQRMLRAQITLRRDAPAGGGAGDDRATVWIGRDHTNDELAVGMLEASQRTLLWVGGARGAQERRIARTATLTLGLDVDAERARITRRGSLTIPAREGDPRIFGQPPGDDLAADRWDATTIDGAGHASIDVRAGRLTLAAGGRLDGWMLGASRKTPRIGTTPGIASQEILFTAAPRGSVQLRLAEGAVVRFDGGRYHQARAASDVSAVFGTPDLGLEEAWHATLGGQWRRAPFAIEAAAYARWLQRLVARDLAVTPLFAQALTQGGAGRVLGVQLTARAVGWRGLSGWLSYTLSRSTRKDANSQPERLFDHDQTHGLIAVAGWERGPWTVGGRLRASTGEPRTGVIGAFFDARSGRFQPIRGAHNGVRLPAFFAADLRAERRLALGAARAYVYAEIQNLTGRANAEEIIYSADFSERAYLTSLPLLAIGGVRVEQ